MYFCAIACACTGLTRSEEHTSELQSRLHLVCRLLLEKKKNIVLLPDVLLHTLLLTLHQGAALPPPVPSTSVYSNMRLISCHIVYPVLADSDLVPNLVA